MNIGRNFTTLQTIKWTRSSILVFLCWAFAIVVLHEVFGFYWLEVPWFPVALIGTALAFYLGFKNNSSYDRLQEGRVIWGGIVNASRTWGAKVIDFPDYSEDVKSHQVKDFIYTHLAWLTALRFALREQRSWEHHDGTDEKFRKEFHIPEYREEEREQLGKYLPDNELDEIFTKSNHATHILKLQSQKLKQLKKSGAVDTFTHIDMASSITEFYDLQGKCERIKNFPFPRQYASMSMIFVKIFTVLLPLGLIGEFENVSHSFAWLVIPFSTLISWVFYTMELVGDYSENPFEGLANDVPISTLCSVIEKDLKQMIGDEDLPQEYPVKKQIVF